MDRLHYQTRRRVCLAAFLSLCVAPTVAVGVWCASRQSPWHVQTEAYALNRQLGMDVVLEAVRHPRPGVVVYEGLRLLDPETGREIVRLDTLEATWSEAGDHDGGRRPAIVLAAPKVECEGGSSRRLVQLLERTLEGQTGRPEMEIRISIDELVLRTGDDSQTLSEVRGGVGRLPGGIQAVAAFRLPGSNATEPVRLRVVRNRQVLPPANGIELDTGGAPLPCRLLAVELDELRRLGPASQFVGRAWAHQTLAGWECDLQGKLLRVDLKGLLSGRSPHQLDGSVELAIQKARFRQGRLEEAIVQLTAGPGQVGRSLIDSAVEHLGLVSLMQPAAGDRVPYDQLSAVVALDARGIHVRGRCSQSPPGTVLLAGSQPLLGESKTQPLPVAALIWTLAPAGEAQIPANRQTNWLAQYLPVPEALPPAANRTSQQQPPAP